MLEHLYNPNESLLVKKTKLPPASPNKRLMVFGHQKSKVIIFDFLMHLEV